MYYSVVLVEDQTNLWIPAAWVFCLDVVKAYNEGVNRNLKRRIFFSKDLHCTPNFLLPLRAAFAPNENACYLAKIKRTFGSIDEAKEYVGRTRGGLPAVYSEIRIETSPSFLIGETQIAAEMPGQITVVEIKTECTNEIESLRRTIAKINDLLPPIDLTCDDEEFIDSGENRDGGNDTVSVEDNNPDYEMVNSYNCFVIRGKNI